MARKSQSKSNSRSASSAKSTRKVHPKRTGIVWGVFVGAMTFAGGVLMLGDGWQGIPAVRVTEQSAAQSPVAIEPGRWQAIVIHHSASAAGTVDEITRQHAAWGLPSLGYHFVIGNGNGEPDGSLAIGPRWHSQDAGAHVAARAAGATPDAAWFNQNAIGICLVGNGERREFTDAQMKTLVALVKDLQQTCGIPDSAVILHSDLVEVASPGRFFPRAQLAFELAN
ncbi:MAG: peptidoglycan recognition family protein [bacterium]